MMGSYNLTESIQIPINGLLVMGITALVTAMVFLLMFRSSWGLQVRAVTQNRRWQVPSGSTANMSIG